MAFHSNIVDGDKADWVCSVHLHTWWILLAHSALCYICADSFINSVIIMTLNDTSINLRSISNQNSELDYDSVKPTTNADICNEIVQLKSENLHRQQCYYYPQAVCWKAERKAAVIFPSVSGSLA